MTTKTVSRHYCDHCRRGMFKRDAMARHEAVCYRNPKRQCHRCNNDPAHAITAARAAELVEMANRQEVIATAAGECPDCLMAHCIRHFHLTWEEGQHAMVYYQKEQYIKDRDAWNSEHKPDPSSCDL